MTEDCENTAGSCRCRAAVTRAYRTLCASGEAESVAFEAAMRVYTFHHPETAPGAAAGLVERWVACGTVH